MINVLLLRLNRISKNRILICRVIQRILSKFSAAGTLDYLGIESICRNYILTIITFVIIIISITLLSKISQVLVIDVLRLLLLHSVIKKPYLRPLIDKISYLSRIVLLALVGP